MFEGVIIQWMIEQNLWIFQSSFTRRKQSKKMKVKSTSEKLK